MDVGEQMKNKITDKMRLKQALRIATAWAVLDHIRSLTREVMSGAAKAETHREICIIFVSTYFCVPRDSVNVLDPRWKKVHEDTQQLTGHLEREIGLETGDSPDHEEMDKMEAKFFEKFYTLAFKSMREYEKNPPKKRRWEI